MKTIDEAELILTHSTEENENQIIWDAVDDGAHIQIQKKEIAKNDADFRDGEVIDFELIAYISKWSDDGLTILNNQAEVPEAIKEKARILYAARFETLPFFDFKNAEKRRKDYFASLRFRPFVNEKAA